MAGKNGRFHVTWQLFVIIGCLCTAIVLGGSIYDMRARQDSLSISQLAAGQRSVSSSGLIDEGVGNAALPTVQPLTNSDLPTPNANAGESQNSGTVVNISEGSSESESSNGQQSAANPAPQITAGASVEYNTPSPDQSSSNVLSLRVRMAGDVIQHGPQLDSAYISKNVYDFNPQFSMITDSLSMADFTIVNFETTCIGEPGTQGYSGYPRFHTPPQILEALKAAGVDMLDLGNNHAVDRFLDGLVATIDTVESYGFEHVGTFRSQEEYDAPNVIEIGGIKIGFIAYTCNINHKERYVDPDRLAHSIMYISKANIAADVQKMRDGGAEVIIALPHWGIEYERTPSDTEQIAYAKQMAEAGVDVILGGHPHVVQPIEWINAVDANGNERKTLVVYSLGNFISNQRDQYTDGGIIIDFTINYDKTTGSVSINNIGYVPTWVWRWDDGNENYEYRIVPCGYSMANRPNGMSDENYARMSAAYQEVVSMIGTNVATPLDR